MNDEKELAHYGVPGMRWGVRKNNYSARALRGHAGPGVYFTKKRQLAGDKRDLEYLNNGGHLSFGITKKRQAAYDAMDKAAIAKRIVENESGKPAKFNERDTQIGKKITKTCLRIGVTALLAGRMKDVVKGAYNAGRAVIRNKP